MKPDVTGFVALLLLAAAPLSAQTRIEHRAAAAADGAVRIQNMVGSVRVIGWERDSIVVTGTLAPGTPRDAFLFHVASGGAKVGLWETGQQPEPTHLELHVPAGSTVWVKTAGADIHVDGVTGGVDANAVSGAIEVTGSPREVLAESLAGPVTVASESRSVRAKSATGAVTLRGRIVDATATTVSGAITIDGTGLERGRFESVDGDIAFAGDVGARSTLDFVNHAGAVHFVLPRDAAAEFVVNTYQGRLDDRFGVRAQATGSALKGREFRFRTSAASLGGQVTVRTFKGDVVVTAER